MSYEGDRGMPGVTHEEPVAERFRAMSRGVDACPEDTLGDSKAETSAAALILAHRPLFGEDRGDSAWTSSPGLPMIISPW
jgi:hypothetical protein